LIYAGFWTGVASAMLLLAAGMAVELISPTTVYSLRDRLFGVSIWFVRTVAASLMVGPLQFLWRWLGVPPIVHLRIGLFGTILLTVVLMDFLIYWRHRFEHRFLWRIHAAHHSVTELHAANSFGHFVEALPHLLIVLIPLSLIDFGGLEVPLAVIMSMSVLQLYIHSPVTIEFGKARVLLVDNRYHRVHHSIQPRHFEKNFGILFTLWDRMFGTAYFPCDDEWPDTGVQGIEPPRSIADYLAFPITRFRRTAARSLLR
jgi:sterol desaturase/sphingolipid hydroxylase (fatty acid hydroxylase superfamily)